VFPAKRRFAGPSRITYEQPSMNRRERRASTRNSRKASESALQAFDRAVQLNPDDVQNWKNLANVLFELPSTCASTNEAMAAYRKVLSLDPRDWEAACRLGYLHFRSGQLEDALACFGLCDTLQPNHAPTLRMRSVFLLGLKRYDEAITEGMRAHALDPTNADVCNTIGSAFNALNRHEEALSWFDRALSLGSPNDKVLYNKALALAKINRVDEAIAIRDELKAKLGADGPDVNGARLLFDLGCHEDALATLDLCLEKRPDEVAALQLRALCLSKLKQFERSLADYQRAHLLDPTYSGDCNNVGAMLVELGRYSEALPWFEKAIGLRPDYAEALNNLALALHHLHRLTEAVDTYTRSRAIDPSNPVTMHDMAYVCLLRGDFEAGWACREVRWAVPGLPIVYPKFSQPMWLGESDIAGKTILIYSDEGLGDAIQFVRYMPMIAARGARVILAVQSPLVPLLSGVDGVSLCVARDPIEALPASDVYCPMMSLPLAFRTRLDTIPAGISYLPAPPEDRVRFWSDRLPSPNKLRVGLVWSGNPNHRGDRHRSIPLREFARILDVDVTFVSLQKELRPDDKVILDESCIFDPTADLTDFGETAALLSCLDLVIAVDTSVAHLAGALGRPTWLLLPYTPDYRWLLDRDDSPWYPTVRLFRQSERRDWTEVIERVRSELAVRSAAS
jgi:tetratricopeptide (TPR) repeat protein